MNRSPTALTITDAFLLCAPILILGGVLLIEGIPGDLWKKPEWSFVSVLLWAEALRDVGVVARKKKIHEEQIGAGYSFFGIFLVLTTLVLVIDFQHSMGISKLNTTLVYFLKYGWFLFCLAAFSYKRFQRHRL